MPGVEFSSYFGPGQDPELVQLAKAEVDKWIVYGGMVGISLLFAALWWLVRG